MSQSRLRFKSVLKHCQRNEDSLDANALAKSYMQKDSYSFWKDIKHKDNAKIPLASSSSSSSRSLGYTDSPVC